MMNCYLDQAQIEEIQMEDTLYPWLYDEEPTDEDYSGLLDYLSEQEDEIFDEWTE